MLAILAGLLLAPQQSDAPLAVGDHWTVERTYRYLNEEEAIDLTQVERTEYSVDEASGKGIVLSSSRRLIESRFGKDAVKTAPADPQTSKVRLGAGGAPTPGAESEDPIRTRVDRMQWAAAEDRRGVSWTRKFDSSPTVQAAKITLKPTGATGDERTIAITYEESSVRGEGVAVVVGQKRLVKSLKLTLTGVYPPGGNEKVKLAVNQVFVANP